MAAPKGNQFWKIRSKHGRDKLFASPELLMEAALEYFEWCDMNPWIQSKSGTTPTGSFEEEKPTARPYSLGGLCIYLGTSHNWLKEFRKAAGKDFLVVISEIENIIQTQQVEGATVGAYNANIVARLNGIVERTENHNTNINHNSEPLSKDELKKAADELENEL